jgi:hypothetical protein
MARVVPLVACRLRPRLSPPRLPTPPRARASVPVPVPVPVPVHRLPRGVREIERLLWVPLWCWAVLWYGRICERNALQRARW